MGREPRNHRALTWVAALLGFCVLAWLIREQGLPDPDRYSPEDDGAAYVTGDQEPSLLSTGEQAVAPLPQPASFGGPAPDPGASQPTPEVPSTVASPTGTAPLSSTSIDVTLDLPVAWLKPKGVIYALRAGAPGVDDSAAIPHAIPAGEQTRLYLPAAGLWDIGYACGIGSTLLEDVRVPETGEIVLRADARPIRIRSVDSVSADAEGIRVSYRAVGEHFPTYPGRGESRTVAGHVLLDAAGRAETGALPTGVPYRMRALDLKNHHGPLEWMLDRPLVQAGEEVTLRTIERGTLIVNLMLGEALPAHWTEHWKTDLWTAVYVVPEGGGEADQRFESTYLQKDGSLKSSQLRFAIPPGRYTLKGGVGLAYHDQTEVVEVKAGEATEVSLTLIPDSSFVLFGSRQVPHWGFHVQLKLKNASEKEAQIFVSTTNQGKPELEHHSGRRSDEPVEIMSENPPGVVQVFQAPYGVSKPLSLPARGTLDIPLREGGLLVVVPDVEPDRTLGRLTLRRPDGALIPFFPIEPQGAYSPDEMKLENTLPAHTGLRIGPLLPGRHIFDIHLGGVRIGRAEAVVLAGRTTPLSLAVRAALSQR